MSKKGAPRKSFTTFVQESKADTIDVPDDTGRILISLEQPHFWPKAAKEAAVREDGEQMLRILVGDDAASAFFAVCDEELNLSPDVAAATLIAYLGSELGGDMGESLASSTS